MCVSPVQLTREICGRKVKVHVPCGHCPECIKDNQNSYVIRTIEEQAKRGSLWFITLTYANEHVPVAFDADGEIIDRELVPLLKNPSKYRPSSFAPQSDIPLDENENFDSESEVCDNPDDMPLDVYYGLPEKKNEWNGLEYAQLDIEADNAISEEDIVDEETGERPSNVYSLNNRDIQLWKKRVRRQIDYHAGRKVDFGYLICGEYGLVLIALIIMAFLSVSPMKMLCVSRKIGKSIMVTLVLRRLSLLMLSAQLVMFLSILPSRSVLRMMP